MTQTDDGGYVIGGTSSSDSGGLKTQNTQGVDDYWIIKIDAGGNKQWDNDYGGLAYDELVNVAQTSDAGYLFSGSSGSNASGDKSENNLAYVQVWLVKTDSVGNKQWDKTILSGPTTGPGASNSNNDGYAIDIDTNCYVICQQTSSGVQGYKTQPNWDGIDSTDDLWIVKFCFTGIPEGVKDLTANLQLNVYPNPFSSELDINLAQRGLKQANFTITNTLGQTIFNQTENNLSDNYTKMLDLSYLPNGVYCVTVGVNGERITREVVKE